MKAIEAVAGFRRLEDRTRLSESALFDLQRQFYVEEGLRAWAAGTVPSYITCNPLIADSYAEVVLGFLRDARASGRLPAGARVPVVEVGSGSGRFGYLFLHRLQHALAASELRDLTITLVLTDFHRAKIDEWRSMEQLAPLLADGSLDLAVLQVGSFEDTTLEVAGVPVSAFAPDAPRVLIANYVLDSVPQDAFAVHQGDLHELLVSVDAPEGAGMRPDALADLRITWTAELVTAEGHYRDADLDAVLDHYVSTLDDTAVLIPTAAIDLVRRFATLGDTPALVIAADKGYLHEQDLLSQPEPGVALHGGCFSLMVNFDAIARVVRRRGGAVFHPSERPASLAVAAYGFGLPQLPATAGAFSRHVVERGPDDVFALRAALAGSVDTMSLDAVMAFVRAYLGDATVFLDCFSRLLDLAPNAPDSARLDLHRLVRQVWGAHFAIGEAADLALCLGLLLSAIERHREALPFFAESRRSHGPTATTAFAEAVAHLAMRDLDRAEKLADEALELEPGFSGARRLKATCAAERELVDA